MATEGGKKKDDFTSVGMENDNEVRGATRAKPDLKDGGNEQPVPLQVLFVVENLTVSQVHHQCFLCVLNTNTDKSIISFQNPVIYMYMYTHTPLKCENHHLNDVDVPVGTRVRFSAVV